MKILVVLEGFFPAQTYGGPTVSIDNLCTLLQHTAEMFILTSDHELNKNTRLETINDGWNDRGNCKVFYMRQEQSNVKFYKEVVSEIIPDIIYVNSLFSAKKTIPFLRIAKRNNIPLLLAPRGELCVNAFDKKYKKIPYILLLSRYLRAKNVWYQSTSEEEDIRIAEILKVSSDRILRLSNVPSLPEVNNNRISKVKGESHLTFISRIQAKKNLRFALEILKNVTSKIYFDIYGPKESVSYWKECENIIKYLPNNIIVSYKGQLKHDEVSSTFSRYHAFLFPTLSENYGHVLVESMLSGCPAIMSDQVPWGDVNNEKAGWSFLLNNKADFINAIEDLSTLNNDDFSELSTKCQSYMTKKIDIEGLKKEYINCLNRIIQNHD